MRVTFALLLLAACANARNHQAALHPGYVPRSLEKLEQQIASTEKLLATKEGAVSKSTYDAIKKTLPWLKKQREDLKNPGAAAAAAAQASSAVLAGLDGPTSEKLEKLERRIATSKQKITNESTTKETVKVAIRKLLPKLVKQRDELLKANPAAAAVAPPAPSAVNEQSSSMSENAAMRKLAFKIVLAKFKSKLAELAVGANPMEEGASAKEDVNKPKSVPVSVMVGPIEVRDGSKANDLLVALRAVRDGSLREERVSEYDVYVTKADGKVVNAKELGGEEPKAAGPYFLREVYPSKAAQDAHSKDSEALNAFRAVKGQLADFKDPKRAVDIPPATVTEGKVVTEKEFLEDVNKPKSAAVPDESTSSGADEYKKYAQEQAARAQEQAAEKAGRAVAPPDALFLSLQESGLATNPKFNLRHY